MSGDDQRNPVIVIPGILGSRLVEESTGKVVWGAFAGDLRVSCKDTGQSEHLFASAPRCASLAVARHGPTYQSRLRSLAARPSDLPRGGGDLDGVVVVGVTDLLILLANWS